MFRAASPKQVKRVFAVHELSFLGWAHPIELILQKAMYAPDLKNLGVFFSSGAEAGAPPILASPSTTTGSQTSPI